MMRRVLSFVGLVACALGAASGTRVLTACASDPDPEIVVGVSSQMRIGKDYASVRVRLEPEGGEATCAVIDAIATPLPRTVRTQGHGKITVTVAAFPGPPPPACDDVTGAVVVRRATTHFVDAETLYLPMALHYSCTGVVCDAGQTCLGGGCASDEVSSDSLVEYDDTLLFSGTSFCVPRLCLDDRVPALRLDDATCTFLITGDVTLDKGINVELVNDNLSREVIDLDPVEGFTVDKAQPDRFQLSPGLCGRWQARKIASISLGVGCPSKTTLNPMCQEDPADGGRPPAEDPTVCTSSADLPPAPSGLYLIVDRSRAMEAFFGDGSDALHEKMSLTLRSPLLRSSQVAFQFLPATPDDCSSTPNAFASPGGARGFPFGSAAAAADSVDKMLADPTYLLTNNPPLYIDAILRNAGGAYLPLSGLGDARAVPTREVLFIGNRDFAPHCDPSVGLPNQETFVAQQGQRLSTGAILLAAPSGTDQGGRDPFIDAVTFARAGGGPFFDATVDPSLVETGVASVFSDLGLCLYDAPAALTHGADLPMTRISYFDGVQGNRVDISYAPDCAKDSRADGWNLDGGRVRICGKSCGDLGLLVKGAAVYALDHHVPPPDVPVKWAPACK